jgi:hypothetical protein
LTTVFGFVLDKNSGQQKSRPKSAFY